MECEVRLQGGREKELGGKYAWKAGMVVALVYNFSTQEVQQKFKLKRLCVARAVRQGLTKKEKRKERKNGEVVARMRKPCSEGLTGCGLHTLMPTLG